MRTHTPSGAPVTLREIEEGIVYITYMVDKYGDAYAPVLDQLEREFEAARQQASGHGAPCTPGETSAEILPRGMTREAAAAYCSLSPPTWDRWVREGRMPPSIPGTHRWDRKAIDLAWDRLSGIATREVSASDPAASEWRRVYGAQDETN